VARCLNGGARHFIHHGFIKSLREIVEEVGIPKVAIMEEARGMRPSNATRPGNIVVHDFAEAGKHLIIDGVVTIVYRNSNILSRVSCGCAEFAAKQVEDKARRSRQMQTLPSMLQLSTGGATRLCPSPWRIAA